MSVLEITGGRRLCGSLKVQGSKNSVLPILAAAIPVNGISVIHNCPRLSDVENSVRILRELGCRVKTEGNTLTVDSTSVSRYEISRKLMKEMRSSVIFAGALAGRFKRAAVSAPGGCEIGLRPIDLHIYALKKLGMTLTEENGKLIFDAVDGLHGTGITFSFPSVGATENAILASCLAEGETTIVNAAREPEIADLCNFLNCCGADIRGGGETVIRVKGVKKLHGCEYTVICDRIAAASYLIAGAVTNGDVTVKNTVPGHIAGALKLLEETGCEVNVRCSDIRLKAPKKLKRMDKIITQPFPGFPTDLQAPMTTLAALCEGTTVIAENIFECRFRHIPELVRMGAGIRTEGSVAVVEGVERLYGAEVCAEELRGGCALVLAGLAADGLTVVDNVKYIDRGYEAFEDNLCLINAQIKRKVNTDEKEC